MKEVAGEGAIMRDYKMTLTPQAIEEYAAAHSAPESELLAKLARETYAKTKEPQMQVGAVEGGLLKLLAKLIRARRVLEIGTFTGYSTLCLAEGMVEEGELITCDIDAEATTIAQKYWKKSPHGKKITLKLQPALTTLQTLPGPFDLIFIDADKENYVRYWEVCVPNVRAGGLLVADNVLWSGRVLNPKDSSDFGIVQFNEHVRKDPRVEAILCTIRDGITLAWKRS